MNCTDLSLGTWYPQGGMHQIIKGMVSLAEELGVRFEYNAEVEKILVNDKGCAHGVLVNGITYEADLIVAGADYHHVESKLRSAWRNYKKGFWDKQIMAPSSLIYYLESIKSLITSCTTISSLMKISNSLVQIYIVKLNGQKGLCSMFVVLQKRMLLLLQRARKICLLMPLAPDLEDTEALREKRFNFMIDKLETITNTSIHDAISVKELVSMILKPVIMLTEAMPTAWRIPYDKLLSLNPR